MNTDISDKTRISLFTALLLVGAVAAFYARMEIRFGVLENGIERIERSLSSTVSFDKFELWTETLREGNQNLKLYVPIPRK